MYKIDLHNGYTLEYDFETIVGLCIIHDCAPVTLEGVIRDQIDTQINKHLIPINNDITHRIISEFNFIATVASGATDSREAAKINEKSNQERFEAYRAVYMGAGK